MLYCLPEGSVKCLWTLPYQESPVCPLTATRRSACWVTVLRSLKRGHGGAWAPCCSSTVGDSLNLTSVLLPGGAKLLILFLNTSRIHNNVLDCFVCILKEKLLSSSSAPAANFLVVDLKLGVVVADTDPQHISRALTDRTTPFFFFFYFRYFAFNKQNTS